MTPAVLRNNYTKNDRLKTSDKQLSAWPSVCWWPSPLQSQTKKTHISMFKQPWACFTAPPFANPHVHIMDASHFKHVIKHCIKCSGNAFYKTHTLETPAAVCNGASRVSGLEHKDIYWSYVLTSALMFLVLPNVQSQTHRVTIPIAKYFERHFFMFCWPCI